MGWPRRCTPGGGPPHRPGQLQVRADERWDTLRPHLEEIAVRLEVTAELEQWDLVFRGMTDRVCGKPEPGLLDMPG